jgi:hypothetical protein
MNGFLNIGGSLEKKSDFRLLRRPPDKCQDLKKFICQGLASISWGNLLASFFKNRDCCGDWLGCGTTIKQLYGSGGCRETVNMNGAARGAGS